MSTTASQINGDSIVCSTVCSGTDKETIKVLLYWPLWGESIGHPHKGPVTRKMFLFDEVIMNCKWSDTLWPVGRVRLFADYTISLSSLCRLIWKHWTTKMLVRYMMPSVCLRLRQFSQLSLYSLYGAVCLQLTQFSCDDRENVYFILLSSSNRKYESLTIV